jgi:tetratricopeptide (TPR) repeat protein
VLVGVGGGAPVNLVSLERILSVDRIQSLRHQGRHEEARSLAVEVARASPEDALAHYEAACVHDYLGLETEAVPYYVRAIELGLPAEELRGAYLGLGSTYRVLRQYEQAIATLEKGLAMFPGGREFIVFKAMAEHNVGRSKQAVEALLRIIAETSSDAQLQRFSRAIMFYAENVEGTLP